MKKPKVITMLLGLAVMLLPNLQINAQEKQQVKQNEPATNPRKIVSLEVDAIAPTANIFAYKLLPSQMDISTGNSISFYLKSMLCHPGVFTMEDNTTREKYLQMPITDPKWKELKNYRESILRNVYLGARMEPASWQLSSKIVKDRALIELPEAQHLRKLITMLRIRLRAEIACGDFPSAHRTMQTMFRMSEDFSKHPTFIYNLIATSTQNNIFYEIDNWIRKENSPNLYWALTLFTTVPH